MALQHVRDWDPAAFAESPWYWPLADKLALFAAAPRFPTPLELTRALTAAAEEVGLAGLRAVPCPPKSKSRRGRKSDVDVGALYDVRIAEHAELPTRLDDWHDFFNALAFAAWPRAKRALHARQARIQRARLHEPRKRLPGARTREQDALTLLDEGGVLVACTPEAQAELRAAGDDLACSVQALSQAGQVRLVPFGHALFEHLVAGLPCPLASPELVCVRDPWQVDLQLRGELNRLLAARLADTGCFLAPHGIKGLSLDGPQAVGGR